MEESYYDFGTANDLLQSLSDGLGDLSPTSLSSNDNQLSEEGQQWCFDDNDKLFNNNMDGKIQMMGEDYLNQDVNIGGSFDANMINNFETDFAPEQLEVLESNITSSEAYSQGSASNMISPQSQVSNSSSRTSPEPMVKSEMDSEFTKAMIKGGSASRKNSKILKKDKRSHNMIEKKYRTNINSKILALRDAVPSLRIATGNKDVTIADLEGLTPASKLNKASVLTKATEYIKHLESKNKVLKDQNRQLQMLIQEATVSNIAKPNSGFGQAPPMNQQSYNVTPVQQYTQPDYNMSNNYEMNNNQPRYGNSNFNKYLMGGLASVVGTSLVASDGSDFKGMSALPIFSGLPSSAFTQVWNLFRIFVFCTAVVNLILPLLYKKKNSKSALQLSSNVWKDWFLVGLGFQLPGVIDEQDKKNILRSLLGKGSGNSFFELFKIYLFLSSAEPNFENCILQLVIGTILSESNPFMKTILNNSMSLKGYLVMNLDYSGEESSLKLLNKLIKVEGISFLGSSELFKRLSNLYYGKLINNSCEDTDNYLAYASFLQENHNDYYGLIFAWRVIKLSTDLTLTKLRYMIQADKDEDSSSSISLDVICEDIEKVNDIVCLSKSLKLRKFFCQVCALISPEKYTTAFLESIENQVNDIVSQFDQFSNDEGLSDEDFSDDENSNATLNKSLKKEVLESFNLVSRDEFFILTTCLILYYRKYDIKKSNDLVKYLDLASVKLSLFSFTSLITLLNSTVLKDGDIEDAATVKLLDSVVKSSRVWVNNIETGSIDSGLKTSLSDFIVKKGTVLFTNVYDDDE